MTSYKKPWNGSKGRSRNIEGRGHIVCRPIWIHLWAVAICRHCRIQCIEVR